MNSETAGSFLFFNRVLSWLYIVFIAVSSIGFFSVALLIRLLTGWTDKRLALLNLFTAFWGSVYTWCMPAWQVTVRGREKMDMKKTYVIVSNHQSQLDILVAFRLLFPFRWVSKAEVFKLPVIGWNMAMNRHIGIKRGDKDSRKQMMAQCEAALAQGASLFFFPEGTRSVTGELKPFKPGAFILAHKMKTPILPVVINGTRDALPKHSLTIRGVHRMRLTVLDELPYERFAHLDIHQTAQYVRRIIASHMESHQPVSGSEARA